MANDCQKMNFWHPNCQCFGRGSQNGQHPNAQDALDKLRLNEGKRSRTDSRGNASQERRGRNADQSKEGKVKEVKDN